MRLDCSSKMIRIDEQVKLPIITLIVNLTREGQELDEFGVAT